MKDIAREELIYKIKTIIDKWLDAGNKPEESDYVLISIKYLIKEYKA